ncbi:MAG TPA: hypothetical protein VHT02_09295 [Methylocella sp.]|nr:hypothetical protein [Methylocella sp.]
MGQLEALVRALAPLGVAVGNFCLLTAIFAKIGVANWSGIVLIGCGALLVAYKG